MKGKAWVEEGAVNEGRPVRRLYSKWGKRRPGQGWWWQCRDVSGSARCFGAKPNSTCCWVGRGSQKRNLSRATYFPGLERVMMPVAEITCHVN